MECERVRELLAEYLYGELKGEESSRIEEHLGSCKRCASEVEVLRKVRRALALLGDDVPILKRRAPLRRRATVKRMLAVAYVSAVAVLLLYFFIPRAPKETIPFVPKLYGAPEVERKDIALTVYNGGFGVVRDGRIVRNLSEGECELSFVDVAARIEPYTVRLRSKKSPEGVRVLAQDFLFDLLNARKLMEKRIGERLQILLKDGSSEEGVLRSVSSEGGGMRTTYSYPPKKPKAGGYVIVEGEGGGMRTIPLRQVSLIRVEGGTESFVTRPTLKWLLSVDRKSAGMNEFELTYLTDGIVWRADYDLVLGANGAELLCWLTLSNRCGTSFKDAKLKLVAGEVHRVRPKKSGPVYGAREQKKNRPQVKEKEFFEYHMYEVMRPVTVRDGETKQIKMFERSIEDIRKEYWITVHSRAGMDRETTRRGATVILLFRNSEGNGLGLPLPKGRVRLFVPVEGENLFAKFSGIEHTPKDEDVRLPFGKTESVVWRIVESRVETGRRFIRGRQGILIRNLSDGDVVVKLRVKLNGDWKITESSHRFVKEDAQTALFSLNIKAQKELRLNYSWETVW